MVKIVTSKQTNYVCMDCNTPCDKIYDAQMVYDNQKQRWVLDNDTGFCYVCNNISFMKKEKIKK